MTASFDTNVFINCPFDNEYRPFLQSLLFTVVKCGLMPRIASERMDSSEFRVSKILELIETSRFSIHDISRSKSSKKGEVYRLNMPFELGLDFACKRYHVDEKYRQKCSLVLEPERFITQKAFSDLGGFDVKCHENSRMQMVLEVRNWFAEIGLQNLPAPALIWENYNEFTSSLSYDLLGKGFSLTNIKNLPIPEFLHLMKNWLTEQT